MTYYTRFDTRFCEIILVGDENGLSSLHLNTGERKRIFEIDQNWTRNDEFFTNAQQQILAYFGERQSFDIKLNPRGTPFQKSFSITTGLRNYTNWLCLLTTSR